MDYPLFCAIFISTVVARLPIGPFGDGSADNPAVTIQPMIPDINTGAHADGVVPMDFSILNIVDGESPCANTVRMIKYVGIPEAEKVSKAWRDLCSHSFVGPLHPSRQPCDFVRDHWNDIVEIAMGSEPILMACNILHYGESGHKPTDSNEAPWIPP